MGKNNNIIEINGTRYDARTGAVLSQPKTSVAKPSHAHISHKMPSAVEKPSMNDVVRRPAKHVPAHTPKPSKTLMRQSVKRPVSTGRKHSKAQGHTDVLVPTPTSDILAKRSAYTLDSKRLIKARHVAQSKLIQHFAPVTSDSNRFSELVPQVAPQSHAARIGLANQVAKAHAKATPQTTSELLETALRQATSHEQEPVKLKRRGKTKKRARIASAAVLAILAIGFIADQQATNLRLHVASAKAGFNIGMPAYRPAGYSVSKIDYSSGVASTTFKSNSDARSYMLTEKPSMWDSQALKDNFVILRDRNYEAVDVAGRTVYIYGNHNATWVNAGVWYVVQSDGSLSNHQLAELASSL